MSGKCKEAGKTASPAAPCYAGLTSPPAGVTETTFIEFGVTPSLAECEAAASNVVAPLLPCKSVTWHSPTCSGCGAGWKLHCYCATTEFWLKDVPALAGHATQVRRH